MFCNSVKENTMPKITRINEVYDVKPGKEIFHEFTTFDGYEILLDDASKISLLVEGIQICYENWGYLWTSDNLNEFIGAEYVGTEVVNGDLSKRAVVEGHIPAEEEAMFVNVLTNVGPLQFAAYNVHNGFYRHAVLVVRTKTEVQEVLHKDAI